MKTIGYFSLLLLTANLIFAENDKAASLKAQEKHYRLLHERGIPGGAWFRYQADLAREELRKLGGKVRPGRERFGPRFERGSELEQTFDLYSGGRALSENLQLERELRIVDNKDGGTSIDTIPGIDVKEMDWKKLIVGNAPAKDPLAGLIPADQHAIFFTSFSSMRSMLDEIDHQGVPVLGLMATRSEDTMTFDKYGEQLCLPLGSVGKLLGPAVIDSMAFTGSDSYLLTGSDLAVLFEAKDVDVLAQAFRLLRAKARITGKAVSSVKGKVAGVAYEGVVSPDRTVSAYQVIAGKVVIVSNSLVQLEKIVRSSNGNAPSIAGLDEYTFFRNRYPLGAEGAMGFLVITDAAIRHWCGARWRIAASRRTRAAAALSELQAVILDHSDAPVDINKVAADRGFDWLGRLEVYGNQIVSADYGSLRFLKPISEMNLYHASAAEARGYAQFRNNYQRQWRQFFDPIAVQFAMAPKRMTADITVMPLILESEYNEMSSVIGEKLLSAGAGDPHQEAVLQYLMALDMKSGPMRELAGMGGEFLGGIVNPFGWIGGWISVYVDDSPLWENIAKVAQKDPDKAGEFLGDNLNLIPAAFNVEVKSPLRLAAFLTSIKAMVMSAAPGSVKWETREHKKKFYVAITSEEGREKLAAYYAITRGMLTVSLNEKVIQRVIDRSLDDKVAQTKAVSLMPGRSIGVRVQREALALLEIISREQLVSEMQSKSWDNLPILNEWKKRGDSPVEFHARHWHTRLICPGGGIYRWNEKDQTMESSVFGHPDHPRMNLPRKAHPMHGIREVRFGLTFEHDGLRAQGEVLRD